MNGATAPQSLRVRQIRLATTLLLMAGSTRTGRRLIGRARALPGLGGLLQNLVGFRGAFPSLAAAQACAARYSTIGHEHPDDIAFHTGLAETTRESDYPVLFHLRSIASGLGRVFDLGGNVGNLFYVFARHLDLRPDLVWHVHDLPGKQAPCERLAAAHGETRVQFVPTLDAASGADLLIVSGALHYFDDPLDAILRRLPAPPRHVIVNRAPCARHADLFTVQDAGSHLVACKLIARPALLAGMAGLGYSLRDSWPAYELQMRLPLHADLCFGHYSGFYFERVE